MRTPLLSVCLITYNHVKYIRDAIDGVLMQKVNFSWELIIADDFSTDGTREILLEYKDKYPDVIKLILQEKNVGAAQNWMDLITAPTSKYIAYFEGDDYWTDPYKLQKQVGFLEDNEEYGLVYSKALIFDTKKGTYQKNIIGKALNNSKELLFSNPIPSLTTVMRTNLYQRYIQEVKPENRNWKMGDYPGWLWFAFNSKIYFLPEITATHRVLAQSASQSLDKRFQFNLSSFDISDYFATTYCNDVEYVKFLENRYLFLYLSCVKHNMQNKNEYIKRLRELKALSWKTRLIMIIFHNLKFSYLFYLIFRGRIPHRLLRNLGPGLSLVVMTLINQLHNFKTE